MNLQTRFDDINRVHGHCCESSSKATRDERPIERRLARDFVGALAARAEQFQIREQRKIDDGEVNVAQNC